MFGTLYQGEIGVLIAAYLFSRGLLIPSSFNVSIIVVIMLTMLTPIVMKVAVILSPIYSLMGEGEDLRVNQVGIR